MSITDNIAIIPLSDDGTIVRTAESSGKIELEKSGNGRNLILLPYRIIDRLKSDGRIIQPVQKKRVILRDIPNVTEIQTNVITPEVLDEEGEVIAEAVTEEVEVIIENNQKFTEVHDLPVKVQDQNGDWNLTTFGELCGSLAIQGILKNEGLL